jgi:hypothetical protein
LHVLETERLALRWLDDVDLGIAFLARFRGNGYACEAASATRDYAESVLRLRRVAMQFERMVHPPLDVDAVCLYASTRPDPMAEAPC